MQLRRPRRTLIGVLTALIVLVCLACGDTTTPVAPTPAIINDTVNGTLGPGGRNSHSFVIQNAGGIDVTVISLSPDPTITIGVGLGRPNGDACTLLLENKAAHQASLISASATVAGTYCFTIYDVGGIAEETTTDYVVTLTHF